MSIYDEHKCPGCGLAMSFIVDNGMILRIPSQEEEDKRRKEILAWDFDVPARGVPEKESPPGTTAKLEKESEAILDRWAPKEGPFRKLARDLWAWLNTHTRLASLRALLAPEVTEPPTDFRSVCPRTGKVRDGDLKYAGSCGGWQCTHHTCTGASCSHCGGTGRCPEKVAEKK
jgi:hypothetical protein